MSVTHIGVIEGQALGGSQKIAIVEAYSGRILEKKIVEGDLEQTLKDVASELLNKKWMPTFSDFMVLRDTIEVELGLPLTKDEFNFYRKFQLRKVDAKKASASLPIYLIVYESLKISEDDFHDRGIAAVGVIYRDSDIEGIIELLQESTRKPSLEEIEKKIPDELIEEMETEVEEMEGGKRGKRKKRK